MEDLRALIQRRSSELGLKGKPMSSREAAARSRGAVSRATIDNIKAGRHSGNIDDGTVDGLALAFDLPRSQILRAMNRSHLAALRPFDVPEHWQRLTHAQRKVVLAVGNGLLASYEQGREDEATTVVPAGSVAHATRLRSVQDVDAPDRAADVGTNRGRARRKQLDRQAETPPLIPDDEA